MAGRSPELQQRHRETRHQVPDEARRNDDGSRRNHGDGHRVHELAVSEPVVPLHDASIQKGNDRQPAAEHEGPGDGEEREERPQGSTCRCRDGKQGCQGER